ncbi:nitroreductase [Pseudoalteromonas tunicata]|uniref:Nitroreductase n=1 Tax=Pseudoalteromonas tunicata D2 TaxID=87626 RepID=A4C5V7_9GAMM|nr:nitroreductase [Pseudoalteromonas tunicata]ATC95335.1 hypothetical protein PTUN_a2935 [Pseudoalteromonas tunicata]AXT30926.1 nitroreductase [Pseudoalteromonas tunicata]EAR29361.1 Nitroreductase [Pseudoalteromonas tunicata D2]
MTPCKPLAELLAECVELAKLAPSSHNCQPWRVHFRAEVLPFDGAIEIEIAPELTINAVPALQNEMWISIAGFTAALLNLLCAAGVQCQIEPDDSHTKHPSEFILCVKLTYQPEQANARQFSRLKRLLGERYTHRGPLLSTSPLTLHNPVLTMRVWPTVALEWHPLAGSKQQHLSQLVARFAGLDFSHNKVWQETYQFIDFSKHKSVKKERGFNIQQLMGPLGFVKRRAYQWLLSPHMMRILCRFGMADKMASELAGLTLRSGQIICLSLKDVQSKMALLSAGELILDTWLQATEQGLAMHPLSVLLQHSDAKTALSQLLGAQNYPLFIARVGKSTLAPEFLAQFRYRTHLSRILTE